MYPLTPVDDIHFSRNRDALIAAIEKFEGRKFNYQPRNEFEEQYAYYPAQTVERIRNQVTMGALKAAAVRLGGLREGRKSIIFVSEGFTSTLPAQLNDPVAAMPGVGNPVSRRPAQPTPQTESAHAAQDFFNSTDLMNDMRDVFDTVNRQNTSIYAVDPRGLAAFEYDINQGVGQTQDRKDLDASLDTLPTLADNTDGRAIVNRNDLADRHEADHAGLERLLPARLHVDAGADRRQVPRDQGEREAARRRRARAQGLLGADRGGSGARERRRRSRAAAGGHHRAELRSPSPVAAVPARFWIGTARGENGQTRVTFAWEPVAPAAGRSGRHRQPGHAHRADRIVADGRRCTKARCPTRGRVRSQARLAGGRVTFEAPPGSGPAAHRRRRNDAARWSTR